MHSSAAPASREASRGTPNTAELSTTRNGRSRLPPLRLEKRIASTSRFGRTISSANTASDNSFESRASVSSAVLSSRAANSVGAVPVIKNSSRSNLAGTIVDEKGFVNREAAHATVQKHLKKA